MHPVTFLRIMGLLDGVSLITLVFIAMPLKYFLDMPIGVAINGPIHGVIFLVYALAIIIVQVRVRWHIGWSLLAVLVAYIPFGNIVFELKLKKMQPNLHTKPLFTRQGA